MKFKSLSRISLRPQGLTIHSTEFSRPEHWSGLLFPSPGDLPNPGIEPRSPSLQVDSLPAEPPGKPKNTGVGSLSLLQGIFPTQKSNQGLLHCRQILYQLSYQGSPGAKESLLYFRCWQLGGSGGGQTSVQGQIPPTDNLVGQEILMAGVGGREGYMQKQHSQL